MVSELGLVLWMIIYTIPNRSRGTVAGSSTDTEATMTLTWLTADWSAEESPKEIVFEDPGSGCICRLKPDHHLVCYGATTCVSFPKNVTLPDGVFDLHLKTTMVARLSAGELGGFHRLRRLDIDANFWLSEIEPGFFAGMTRLVNLSISFNTELRFLHASTFEGLDNLRRLKLIKNGFRSIVDAAAALKNALIPKVRSISLSENVFAEINETSFDGLHGTGLTELDLVLCQIERIHPRALVPFKRLEKLRIGENILSEDQLVDLFDNMAAERIPIKLLNLYELGFRKGSKLTSLLHVVGKLNVTHLNLRRNHIESLYEGLFPAMPHLHTLDLREVSAVAIEPNALGRSLMPKLKTLLLGGNRLSGATPGVLPPQLSDLDLSANTGVDLPSYFDVNSNIFENMTRLISLNLSFNRIAVISNTTFNGVHHLRVLGLKNATIFHIAENSFRMLTNLFLLNLEDNPFSPFNTFPDLIFDGLERLEILLLSNCEIAYFRRSDIFKSLTLLRYLNLKGNRLVRIDPGLFKPLPGLFGLDLSSNQLTPWDYPLSLNVNPKVLLLPQNRFTYLTGAMMDDFFGVPRVDISGNPFVCDVLLLHSTCSWLRSRNLTLNETILFDASNVCLSPDEWRDRPLAEFLLAAEDGEEEPEMSLQKYIAIAIVICVMLAGFCSALFRYRWHVRYWIFLAKTAYLKRREHFGSDSKAAPTAYRYDAFVSYSHEDRNFVARLVSKLENEEPYLKLCVYERDFEIGSVITESIMDKVNASRKVMFIVSNAFARSQWCIWELQLAEYHRVFLRFDRRGDYLNDSLIMIKLGPLVKSFVTPILKYMLRTRVYLEWSPDYKKQKVFWDKLRKCLQSSVRRDNTTV